MTKLAIKGHSKRGKEVIEILEMLGGKVRDVYKGDAGGCVYIVDERGVIDWLHHYDKYAVYSLEDFLKKFPHKIGDKVCFPDDLYTPFTINKMWWDENANELLCSFIEDDIEVPVVGVRAYKGESIDKTNKVILEANAQSCDIMNDIIKKEDMEEKGDKAKAPNLIGEDYSRKRFGYKIPQGYEFDCIQNNEIIIKPIKPQYPKTYEECCMVLQDACMTHKGGYKGNLIQTFQKLLICRDAYWKIAGEEMGLGKTWEPDWNEMIPKYTITVIEDKIVENFALTQNYILAFPTAEMRGALYESFKGLIEQCKEFL